MNAWREIGSALDREVFTAAGYGHLVGLGEHPALLVVDVTYGFVGHEPLPILESIRTYPSSCGEAGWQAIGAIRRLIYAARQARILVAYSAGTGEPGRWSDKQPARDAQPADAYEIVEGIAPASSDIVVRKAKPSAFFGTTLIDRFREASIDGVIVAGGTTSGCVRATVVDAFSHDLRVTVAEDGVFDRSRISHDVALFDMAQKYADVRPTTDVIADLPRTAADHA